MSVRLYRDGIADALRRDSRFRVVGSAASLDDAQRRSSPRSPAPGRRLVDLDLAEGVDAVRDAARRRGRRRASSRSPCARPTRTSSRGPRPASPVSSRATRRSRELLDAVGARVTDEVPCRRPSRPRCCAASRRCRVRARRPRRRTLTRARARDREPDRRRALEQGDRRLAPHRARRRSRTTCTTSSRSWASRRRTEAVVAARARGELEPDLDPRSRRIRLRLDPKSDPAIHSRAARRRAESRTAPRGEAVGAHQDRAHRHGTAATRDRSRIIAREPDLDARRGARRGRRRAGGGRARRRADFVIVGRTPRPTTTWTRSSAPASACVRSRCTPTARRASSTSSGRIASSLGEISPDTLLRTIRAVAGWDVEHVTDETSERRTV